MKKKLITRLIMILGLIVIIFLAGCTAQKECNSAKDCITKNCFNVDCTKNTCSYTPISSCCGNEKCEQGEKYETCSDDCPNCDDKNECTIDEYDYHKQKCVNTIIPNNVCCGNNICEAGEDYSNCAVDCPNCADENSCTKDSYDYHERKCINEKITSCCGNDICEVGVEATKNCEADCPSCNDNNKLTTDSFNYETQKCENKKTHYFIDDFENGLAKWTFTGPQMQPEQEWELRMEGSKVLVAKEHKFAHLIGGAVDDFIFKSKFKLIKFAINFNFRLRYGGGDFKRYAVEVSQNGIALKKSTDTETHLDLVRETFSTGNKWHTIEIRAHKNIINVFIDDQLIIKYKDINNPVLSGGVALEPLDTSEFLIDDVEMKVISEDDIISP